MKIRAMSTQRVLVNEMFDFEFVGAGCELPDDLKTAILWDLFQSIAIRLTLVAADAATPGAAQQLGLTAAPLNLGG